VVLNLKVKCAFCQNYLETIELYLGINVDKCPNECYYISNDNQLQMEEFNVGQFCVMNYIEKVKASQHPKKSCSIKYEGRELIMILDANIPIGTLDLTKYYKLFNNT
jgi:hypothetical protein